jgi:hypothetical protein
MKRFPPKRFPLPLVFFLLEPFHQPQLSFKKKHKRKQNSKKNVAAISTAQKRIHQRLRSVKDMLKNVQLNLRCPRQKLVSAHPLNAGKLLSDA